MSDIGYQSFYQAQLTAGINDTDVTIPVSVAPIPDAGFLVIEPLVPAKREIIYYTSKSGLNLTVPSGAGNGRGYDGTTAVSHLSGADVIMAPVGAMFTEINDRGGIFSNTQYFTSSDTWNKPNNLKFVIVEVQGGGGAGGGTAATNSSQYAVGTGGGGGHYALTKIIAASLGSSEVVTVGAGGTGVSGAGGNNGGTSSFGTHCIASGGIGGTANLASNAAASFANPNINTMTVTGDFRVPGQAGGFATTDPGNANVALGGNGGNSHLGAGARSQAANSSGSAGVAYGGGGGGSARSSSSGASTGGAGAIGIVIVHEYY